MALNEQILAATMPRESKAEIIDYYRAVYPGSKTDSKGRRIEAWRTHATSIYAQVTGFSRATAAREFQGVRASSSGKRNAAIWEEIGDMIPGKAPEGGFHISGWVHVRYSKDCEERHIDIEVTGDEADKLVLSAAKQEAEQGVVNAYNETDVDDPKGYESCDDPDLEVEPIE